MNELVILQVDPHWDSSYGTTILLVSATTLIVLVVIAMLLDMMMLYRKRKQLADKEMQIHRQKIDELLYKHEMENINAMLEGQDTERQRIAKELHDGLGNILFTTRLHLGKVEKQLNSKKDSDSHGKLSELLDEATDEVRRISHDLYQSSLAKFSYSKALTNLINTITETGTVNIDFESGNIDPKYYKPFERELYRITQELLSNTLKHANAQKIEIKFRYSKSIFQFDYKDDGQGFSVEIFDQRNGIGIDSIRSRCRKIGGEMDIDSAPGRGMHFVLRIKHTDANHKDYTGR